MKYNFSDDEVRRFTWAEPGGELHIDIIKLMEAAGIPWSEENERSVTRGLMQALGRLYPEIAVTHLVDRKPPAKPRGN